MSEAARSPRLWVPVCCFLAAATLVPLLCQRRRVLPADVPAVITSLQSRHPDWRFTRYPNKADARTVYVVSGEVEKPAIWPVRVPNQLPAWKGIVQIDYNTGNLDFDPQLIEQWGEHFAQLGPFVLFGDPKMVRTILNELVG